jgi:hypothetical protein
MRGCFFELILQGEEDGDRPFSSRNDNKPLGQQSADRRLFVSGGNGLRFNAVSVDSANWNSLRINTHRSYVDTLHKTTVRGL